MAEARDNGSQSALLASVIGGAVLARKDWLGGCYLEAERRGWLLAPAPVASALPARGGAGKGSRDGELGGNVR